ncbi:nitrate reductase molybdenum cofactor assembly chaperone [Phaeovibrio sulfidiphilus]|uniref:Nitrate reductase molybdenum cofactor assembly chaperone n=1 Tax=Phaeovibrio sulfidiphilus TaxID=1220600 RepID=A0A8J6YVV5_9PROT|nr:nitrate reductase molybdenum cofactor assembly chaperone [Phaeovibrio sulfidiphilus]MBE1237379.1 nitrate reductase molybdenum cofactor assembly chaperone [Phaeovibrio sulfidiphilus]
METFRILGLLLDYPNAEVVAAGPALIGRLAEEGLLHGDHLRALGLFVERRMTTDLLEIQEDYVHTFDRTRSHCLHLFEHVHGESRDRGTAMVALLQTYEDRGLSPDSRELPDYLPLFLEFLSQCSPEEAREFLGDAIAIVALIGQRLRAKASPYACVFDALESLSDRAPDEVRVAALGHTAGERPDDRPDDRDEPDASRDANSALETPCFPIGTASHPGAPSGGVSPSPLKAGGFQ